MTNKADDTMPKKIAILYLDDASEDDVTEISHLLQRFLTQQLEKPEDERITFYPEFIVTNTKLNIKDVDQFMEDIQKQITKNIKVGKPGRGGSGIMEKWIKDNENNPNVWPMPSKPYKFDWNKYESDKNRTTYRTTDGTGKKLTYTDGTAVVTPPNRTTTNI